MIGTCGDAVAVPLVVVSVSQRGVARLWAQRAGQLPWTPPVVMILSQGMHLLGGAHRIYLRHPLQLSSLRQLSLRLPCVCCYACGAIPSARGLPHKPMCCLRVDVAHTGNVPATPPSTLILPSPCF